MNDRFENLREQKKENILNASIKEFAEHGYDLASTDSIAQRAGISKGSLFNYFSSKINMYTYVVKYCIKIMNEQTLSRLDNITAEDFYDRLKEIISIKHRIILEYIEEAQIVSDFLATPPSKMIDCLQEIMQYNEINENLLNKYLINYLDEKKLRDGITKNDVIFITYTLTAALSRRHIELRRINIGYEEDANKEGVFALDKYIEVLKHGVYKE